MTENGTTGIEIPYVANLDARAPSYAHDTDAGADLRCTEATAIKPGERKLVGTGVSLQIPAGYAGFVHPRSGLAIKQGISVLNAPGTIDSDYRGEIKVILINHSDETVALLPGDRIAQLVIQPVVHAQFTRVSAMSVTARAAGGFGSTGS